MEVQLATRCLQVAGALSVCIGLGHTAFHRIFGWDREFAKISALNRRVLTTVHMATTLFLLLIGFLTFHYAGLLAQPAEAAAVICIVLTMFWLWRLLWQVFYFRPSRLKPQRALLALHYLLVIVFSLLTAGYGAPLFAVGVDGWTIGWAG
jgi:hypothetical protein